MAIDIFDLPDEEILKLDPSKLDELAAQDTSTETGGSDDDTQTETDGAGEGEGQGAEAVAGAEGTQATDAGDDGEDEGNEGEATGTTEGTEEGAADGAVTDPKVEGASSDTPQTSESKDKAKGEQSEIDYKAEYEKLLAPFNANGREISVKSVEDAKTLMQMGANYHKKMAAIKPNLKLLKMLESNDLLSEEKINFLIDLEKKNPDAINKLIKDSGLDPMDLDAGKADGYKPTQRKVDDAELELDDVLERISATDSYQRTLGIVSQEWDAKSKATVANSPQILEVINEHVRTGVYDIIQAEMESERMLGRLRGLSDIEAYRQVGDAIHARGGFDHLGAKGQQTQQARTVVQPKPKKVEDEKIKEKRRAAGTVKPAVAAPKTNPDFNPLAMSDEEFAKIGKTNLF